MPIEYLTLRKPEHYLPRLKTNNLLRHSNVFFEKPQRHRKKSSIQINWPVKDPKHSFWPEIISAFYCFATK